jgi:serine/threonine protein kinase
MPLVPGSQVGPYKILALCGSGGMGEVNRARDGRLGRDVALKVLRAELSGDPQYRLRLEREAKSLSRLQHPRVCTLYDIGPSHHQDSQAHRRAHRSEKGTDRERAPPPSAPASRLHQSSGLLQVR